MTPSPVTISPEDTLQAAAETMEAVGCGALPVGAPDRLVGMITDRDITIRAVARGRDVKREKVRHYMTPAVYCCYEYDTLEQAADLMRDCRVTRLVVKDSYDHITGIISFGAILRKDHNSREVGKVVQRAVGRQHALASV